MEWYTRGEGGRWSYQSVEREGTVAVEGLGLALATAALSVRLDGLDED